MFKVFVSVVLRQMEIMEFQSVTRSKLRSKLRRSYGNRRWRSEAFCCPFIETVLDKISSFKFKSTQGRWINGLYSVLSRGSNQIVWSCKVVHKSLFCLNWMQDSNGPPNNHFGKYSNYLYWINYVIIIILINYH